MTTFCSFAVILLTIFAVQLQVEAFRPYHHHFNATAKIHHSSPEIRRNLHEHCRSDIECGTNAFCSGGGKEKRCRCKLGYLPAANHTDQCTLYNCKHDSECGAHFGHKTKCHHHSPLGPSCGCASTQYLKLDEHTQRCVTVGCRSKFDCSDGMFCYFRKCRCKLGFVPQANGYQCSEHSCSSDSDCQQFDYNARCFRGAKGPHDRRGICKCNQDYYLDERSHFCLRNLETFATKRNIFFLIASFIFIIPATICLIRACQKRTLDEQLDQQIFANSTVDYSTTRRRTLSMSPISNAVSRHQIFTTINSTQQSARAATQVKSRTDLPPSYENVGNTELNSNLFTGIKLGNGSGKDTPPPTYDTANS